VEVTIPLEAQLIPSNSVPLVSVFGSLHQFLVAPDDASGAFGLMLVTVGPGIAIPLHSHADPEVFYVLEGQLEFLRYDGLASRWMIAGAGDTVCIPGDVKHTIRNRSTAQVVLLLVTTPGIYNFFQELGRPYNPDRPPGPPASEDIQRLLKLVAKYGYWIASPEENAEIGLIGF
jgi:quercetin dioxygenase-like cupin family protein